MSSRRTNPLRIKKACRYEILDPSGTTIAVAGTKQGALKVKREMAGLPPKRRVKGGAKAKAKVSRPKKVKPLSNMDANMAAIFGEPTRIVRPLAPAMRPTMMG